jgi:hypothetical protein
MIEGINYTPTQADSHAELQARNGWSVAAMRDEINALKEELLSVEQSRSQWQAEAEKQRRRADRVTTRAGNALRLLKYVHCGNTSQALVNHAQTELGDVVSGDIKPLTKTMTAGEMVQDQTCFIEVSTLAPFDRAEPDVTRPDCAIDKTNEPVLHASISSGFFLRELLDA